MEEKILTEKQEELINLIKKEFKDENKYIKWEKTINKTIVNKNDEIVYFRHNPSGSIKNEQELIMEQLGKEE